MDKVLIDNFNSLVKPGDKTYHLGDFTFKDKDYYLKQLNGEHIFIKGNHDRFFIKDDILEIKIEGEFIVLCHYPLCVWNKSHFNSWHLYGHVHNSKMFDVGKKYNVGVDANAYFPLPFTTIKRIMSFSGNNLNYIGNRK